jgi:hypothetical protein
VSDEQSDEDEIPDEHITDPLYGDEDQPDGDG